MLFSINQSILEEDELNFCSRTIVLSRSHQTFFSNYLSSFFFLVRFFARSMYHNDWRLTRSYIYINTFLRMERKELNSSANRYQYISKLHLVFLWITSFFFWYVGKKNRNDLPFCFFNRFIVRILFRYSFFFSFCLYRILF
jgi:hypothetical protein